MKIIAVKLLFFFVLACSFKATAQKVNLDDLVPFKKGNKWGIVHQDSKPFYPATLDSVLIGFGDGRGCGVYNKEGNESKLARVIVKGKAMYLTPDKKLKPATFSLDGPDNETPPEEDYAVMPVADLEENETIVESFTTPFQKNKVIIKRKGSKYHFYINDTEIPAFESIRYQTHYYSDYKLKGVILHKEDFSGFASFETGTLTVPFQYKKLVPSINNPEWLIFTNNLYKGIITVNNVPVTTSGYQYLKEIWNQHKYNLTPVIAGASEDADRFFLFPEIDSASKIRYDDLDMWVQSDKHEPLFIAIKGIKKGIVSMTDKIIVPIEYDELKGGVRFTILSKNKKFGFADHINKHFIKQPLYDSIIQIYSMIYSKNGLQYVLFLVKRGKHYFYVDNFGKEFISK